MKKFLSILIVLLMCFPFIAPLSNLPTVTAQKSIEGKNVSVEKSNLILSVSNISISGVDTSNIKESYVTECYKTSVLIPKVLLTEIITKNTAGESAWAKTFGGSDYDYADSVQQTADGGYIVGGITSSFGAGNDDFLVLKIDLNGNITWSKTFGGIYKDYAESIQQTSDGGCILAGYTRSFGVGESDLLILKLNSNGDIPGSSCNYLKDVTSNLIVNSQTLIITSPDPSVSMISLSSNTPTLTFTSPTFQSQTICEEPVTTIVIKLQIGKSSFTVNNETKTLDSPPVIKNSRTLLPIRVIIESLGGTVSWDATERKVTVALKDITIQLWIGKSQAKINGVTTLIDLINTKVVPEIINSRTMLPLRFITENLGAEVIWDSTTQTVTITYQP